jgi:CheY-like chemotaxis protein
MLALVDDILDVAKIETGALVITPVEMDLQKLLGDAAQLWSEKARAKGLALHLDAADAPGRIVEDQARLRQVVFNLMSNAIKFTEAGDVALRAHVEKDGDGDGEALVIQVRDSGIGIPADKLEEIFEPFRQVDGGVTRKYEGTGLGLSICRQLALAMGGELSVTSTVGEGSTFTVRLPLRRAALGAAPAGRAEGSGAVGLAGASVLLVEANPLAQSVLKAALGPRVATIEVAATLPSALTLLNSRPFDLVLAEGRTLADGDDALGGLASLRTAAGDGRLSVLWGGAPADAPSLVERGAHHVAAKPISTADLLLELQSLFSTAADGLERSPAPLAV